MARKHGSPLRPHVGGGIGVSAGLYNYATVTPEIPLNTWKLKANRVLNNSGKGKERLFYNCSAKRLVSGASPKHCVYYNMLFTLEGSLAGYGDANIKLASVISHSSFE